MDQKQKRKSVEVTDGKEVKAQAAKENKIL